jgi:uncharacterized protein with von Willebrand factor type A (vWA) domain
MIRHHLPFWPFFEEIETTLSYERWIDKYRLFVDALLSHHIGYDKDWKQFKQFCKILYLQDHRDEEVFDRILAGAIEKEKGWLASILQEVSFDDAGGKNDLQPDAEKVSPEGKDKDNKEDKPKKDAATGQTEKEQKTREVATESKVENKTMYYHPPDLTGSKPENENSKAFSFLQTDEYFAISRRQMVKAWQFLRLKDKGRKQEDIDLVATVEQIAKDGIFLEPKYRYGKINREDTIIIFADYRGSMTPFHELTNRLIRTAKGEGGHPRACVFYFKNYPVGYVYERPNLSQPVKLRQALIKTNRNFTLAIVISDAGAARGNKEGTDLRATMTGEFIQQLRDTCAHTIWLNPMPVHRWSGTAAEKIRKDVFLMAPIMEQGQQDLQDTLRAVLKQHIKPLRQ